MAVSRPPGRGPDAWRELALAHAITAREAILWNEQCCRALVAICDRAGVLPGKRLGDAMVEAVIGSLDFSTGVRVFTGAWTLQPVTLPAPGQEALVQNILRTGITVRELLRRLYGISAAACGDASPASERRAFLRALRNSRQTEAVN